MGRIEKLRERAAALKRQLATIYYAWQDPALPRLPKVILGITLAYALCPIDLIPDFIPVLGYLDDLVILPALIALAMKKIPASVWEAARARAEAEPPRLGKNWAFAVLFVAVWAALIAAIVFAVLGFIKE